jgi:superfamily I DNA and RNA helicase
VNEWFTTICPDEIVDIRENYKVVDVVWFDETQVNSTIFADEYFNSKPDKKKF